MEAHRALLIKLPRDKCDVDYIRRLMALTNLAYKGYEVWAPDISKTIQHQLFGFKNFKKNLVFGTTPKGWLANTWVPLKTARIYPDGSKMGDKKAPVILDLKRNIIKLYYICKYAGDYVEIPMPKWVIDRVKEGGDVKFARIGLKDDEPYLALIAEREVKPYEPSEYILVVDTNSWKYGIAWGLIRNDKLITWKNEKPDTFLINTLYHQIMERGRKISKLAKLSFRDPIVNKIKRQVHARKRKIYNITRDKAYFLASKLVKKALKYKASLIIDDITEESRKKLLEEGLPKGVVKLLMSNLKRFTHQLETLAQWYGVPYEFRRLPSTICPVCNHELIQLPGRIMVCPNCGFKAPRDMVPMYWAIKYNNKNKVIQHEE